MIKLNMAPSPCLQVEAVQVQLDLSRKNIPRESFIANSNFVVSQSTLIVAEDYLEFTSEVMK